MPKPTPDQIAKLQSAYDQLVKMRQEVASMPDESNVKEEMHPEFGTLERMELKNLSNAPTEGDPQNIAWLKKNHPDLDIRNYNGRIVAKGTGETQYRVLDPNTGFHPLSHPGEALRDLGDNAWIAPQAIGETASGALGAAGGSVAGGLAGSVIPGLGTAGGLLGGFGTGALAGYGAGGAGLEALRQKLGQYLGINSHVNSGDVKSAGVISAAAPVLFGGASLGLKAARGALPLAGQIVSGVPKDVLNYGYKNLPKLDQLDRTGVTTAAQDAYRRVVQPLQQALNQKGKELAAQIEQAGGRVDITGAKAAIRGILNDYQNLASQGEIDNDTMKATVGRLQGIWDKYLTHEITPPDFNVSQLGPDGTRTISHTIPGQTVRTEIGDNLTPSSAWELQKQIANEADMAKMPTYVQALSNRTAGAAIPDKRLIGGLDDAYHSIGDGLETATQSVDPSTNQVTSSASLKDQYKQLADMLRKVNNNFGNEQQTYSTLTNLGKKSKQALSDTLIQAKNNYGVDVGPDAQLFISHGYLGEPQGIGFKKSLSTAPSWLGGGSATLRGAMGAGIGVGAANGAYNLFNDNPDDHPPAWVPWLGALAGASLFSPSAMKTYLRGARMTGKVLGPGMDMVDATTLSRQGGNYVAPAAAQSAWHLMGNENSPTDTLTQTPLLQSASPYVLTPEEQQALQNRLQSQGGQ